MNALWTSMTKSTTAIARLAPLAAAIALVASACGSTTTSTLSDAAPTAATPTGAARTTTATPTTGAAVSTVAPPSTRAPITTAPATTAPTTTTATKPVDPPTATAAQPTNESAATCGEFGPIPPRPDSMPTSLRDTDGDGADDDEVTAYGGTDSWMIRVVQNGVVSEAAMPDISGFAAIAETNKVAGRDHVDVRDFETDGVYTFATNDSGCVELISRTSPSSSPADPIDDLTVGTLTTISPIPTLPLLATPPAPCGVVPPIPDGASINSDLLVDWTEDGSADDRLVSYLSGGDWTLRAEVDGTVSEAPVADVGPHAVNVLGLLDIGALTAGQEIVSTVGGGASGVEIGVFGIDANDCLFQFDSGPVVFFVGETINNGSGVFCGDDLIAGWSWERQADDTFTASSAAYHEVDPGILSYMPASDDYSEGLTADQLTPAELNCNGLSL